MTADDDGTDVPVVKDRHVQGPIPSRWRPALKNIVDAFAHRDYRLADGVAGVTPVPEDTASHIQSAIEAYGATLVPLPPASWATSVCIWVDGHWTH